MQKRRFRAPSPALVISLIALFIALGGTTYAATSLPADSVGTKQLRKNAVTPAKIKKGAVTASKINAKGLSVPNAAALGGHAASFFSPATLPPGQSESGVWVAGGGSSTGGFLGNGVAFPTPLAAPLDASHVVYLASGTDSNCAGSGHAAPGYLCVYAAFAKHLSGAIFDHTGLGGSDPYGFFLGLTVTGTSALAYGSWTVTAP
jgi:hypothetical protein